jgi:hypothetical protein
VEIEKNEWHSCREVFSVGKVLRTEKAQDDVSTHGVRKREKIW